MQIINDENSRYSCNNPNVPIKNTYSDSDCKLLQLGDKAPDFTANTTFGECKLSDYKGKWLVFFCHPGDFTPVCTTEFISFSKYYPQFKKRNCELLGLSVDNMTSHLSWVYDIYKNTGIKVPFPIIADKHCKIAKLYHMMNKNNETTVRNVYIICPNGNIRAILQYPATLGRNISEILRMVDALQEADINNVATPANWISGMSTILPIPTNQAELLEKVDNMKDNNCFDWYLCFNKNKSN